MGVAGDETAANVDVDAPACDIEVEGVMLPVPVGVAGAEAVTPDLDPLSDNRLFVDGFLSRPPLIRDELTLSSSSSGLEMVTLGVRLANSLIWALAVEASIRAWVFQTDSREGVRKVVNEEASMKETYKWPAPQQAKS